MMPPNSARAWQKLGKPRLTAKLGIGFVECDLMATRGGDGSGLHPGGAASDHNHLFAAEGWGQGAKTKLAPRFGMLDAGNRQAAMKVTNAGLIATDAGANVVQASRLRLGGHQRIGDQGTGHASHIGLACRKDGLGNLRLLIRPATKTGTRTADLIWPDACAR